MAHQSTFSASFPPIPEFNALNRVKHLCHTFKYFETPAIMESPSNKIFLKRTVALKASIKILNTIIVLQLFNQKSFNIS